MKNAQLHRLLDALDFLDALRDPNDLKIWSRTLETTAAALGAEGACYWFYDTLGAQLVRFNFVGAREEKADPVALGRGLAGWTAKFKQPTLVAHAGDDERFEAAVDAAPGIVTRSALYVPLFVELDFSGVFGFYNKAAGPFDESDQRLVSAVIAHTAHAIRRLRLEDMVNRVTTYNASILDNLSGGFLAVNQQGRVMIANPAARRILGIQGEVTDQPVEKALVHIPDLAAVLRQTLSSKQTAKRQDLRWKFEGRDRVLGYSTLIIQDTQGGFAGAGVTFQDITANDKAS